MATSLPEHSTSPDDIIGFWIKQNGRQELCWRINGGFITDRTLRRWIYDNNRDGPTRYVGLCILKCHTDQYARAQVGCTLTSKATP